MNWHMNKTEQLACLAIIAGLAVGCFGVSPASAGFSYPYPGIDEKPTIDDPTDLKNPQPDDIDIWDEGDPDGGGNPIGHIDIPEIDKDGKPKAPPPTTLFLPPLPDSDDDSSIFGDLIPDPNIDWMLKSFDAAPLLDGPPLPGSSVIVSSSSFNGVPAPGGLGVLGLGLLALNRRRRS